MSVQATAWVWEHSKASGTGLLILLAVADAANREGENSCPSVATIAAMVRVDRATVFRHLLKLKEAGEIEETGTHETYQTKIYKLPLMSSKGESQSATGGVAQEPRGGRTCATQPQKTYPNTPPTPPGGRATSAPEHFEVTEDMRAWWTEKGGPPGHNLAAETEKFLDHHRAKGSTFKNWRAAWQNWMRNAIEYHPRSTRPPTPPHLDEANMFRNYR